MYRSIGTLIAFEGIDGTGKSTQLALLAEFLKRKGYPVVITREPTDGSFGKKIRELYNNRKATSIDEEMELFIKDRQQHVEEVILPGIESGKVVLTDRYYFSTAAYQGAAGYDPDEIFKRNGFAPEPDIVILLTMKPEISIDRIMHLRGEKLNDFEQLEQLRIVARLFNSFTHDCIRRIDASSGVNNVQKSIQNVVMEILAKKESIHTPLAKTYNTSSRA